MANPVPGSTTETTANDLTDYLDQHTAADLKERAADLVQKADTEIALSALSDMKSIMATATSKI